jgi:hypothetical protein
MTMSNPPAVPQALLNFILRADARETVCGDLLEEYHEARIPELGQVRANFWYWRQVGGIWLRTYWWFVVPIVLLLVVHDVFNTFRATSGASYLDGLTRLALVPVSPLVAISLFALAAAYGSWRSQRWAGGFVAALGMFLVIWLFMAVWWNATFYPFAQVQQSNPYWIQTWHWSTYRGHPPPFLGLNPDTPDESFLRWIFWDNLGALFFFGISMLSVSVVCGGIGSTLGLITTRWRRFPASKPH